MLIESSAQNSSMSFRKKVVLRVWLSALIILMGIITIALMSPIIGDIFQKTTRGHLNDFTNGFYVGLGSGLLGAGLVMLIKSITLLKNNEKFKHAEIMDGDERNRFIVNKTFATTTYVALFAILIATIIAGLYNLTVFLTLLCALAVYGAILFISYLIIKAKF